MTVNRVYTLADGRQVWVAVWDDGTVTCAERANDRASWGPRIEADRVEVVQ